jgi:hypothetical protein
MTFPFVDRQIEPIPKVFASFLVGFLRQGPVVVPPSSLGTLGSIFLFKSKLEIKFEDEGTY